MQEVFLPDGQPPSLVGGAEISFVPRTQDHSEKRLPGWWAVSPVMLPWSKQQLLDIKLPLVLAGS